MSCKRTAAGVAGMLVAVLMLIPIFSIQAAGETTDSYTHWVDADINETVDVYNTDVFRPAGRLDVRSLKLERNLRDISDICCDSEGKLYILDGKGSAVLILAPDYRVVRTIDAVTVAGEEESFRGAASVYVDGDGKLYIADTENARVLLLDMEGDGIPAADVIETPQADVLPENFEFRPMAVTTDNHGFLYVVSDGSYYGALVYSAAGEFQGFYGANTVAAGLLDSISNMIDLFFTTDEMRAASSKSLPYQFVDLCRDNQGYLYTVTGTTTRSVSKGQIRKLSPGGQNILYRKNGTRSIEATEVNFGEMDPYRKENTVLAQNFSSIQINEDGYIFALERTLGKIYVYDQECNPLSVFGGGAGDGTLDGSFSTAGAIAVSGDRLYVSDTTRRDVTVFTLTDYGRLLMQAQTMTLEADYQAAMPLWEEVLRQDANSQLALCGLAKGYYAKEDYTQAMRYARAGWDRGTYNQAFKQQSRQFIQQNFLWLFAAAVAVIGGAVALLVVTRKRQLLTIRNVRVKTLFSMPVHPFAGASAVKYGRQGSVLLAALVTALFYVAQFLQESQSGFLFSSFRQDSYNALFTLARTVGVVLLWSVCNWAVAGLFDGKGRLSEVFIVTAYSLLPMVAYTLIRTLLTHVLSYDSGAVLSMLSTVITVITAFILCVGIMTVHDFDFFRFLLTGLITLFGMILVVFILFMIVTLLQESYSFVVTLVKEIFIR